MGIIKSSFPDLEDHPLDSRLQASGPSGREHDDQEDPGGDRARDQVAGDGAPEVGPGRPQATGLGVVVRTPYHR